MKKVVKRLQNGQLKEVFKFGIVEMKETKKIFSL